VNDCIPVGAPVCNSDGNWCAPGQTCCGTVCCGSGFFCSGGVCMAPITL
jgi:hypothetical protein